MSWWLGLRLAKWFGVGLLSAGTLGAFLPERLYERQLAAYLFATTGFVFTWTAGFGMARHTEVSMGAWWIAVSMLGSLAHLQVLVWAVEREGRRTVPVALLAAAALTLSMATMVLRGEG